MGKLHMEQKKFYAIKGKGIFHTLEDCEKHINKMMNKFIV